MYSAHGGSLPVRGRVAGQSDTAGHTGFPLLGIYLGEKHAWVFLLMSAEGTIFAFWRVFREGTLGFVAARIFFYWDQSSAWE